ncbi:MAG: hypothetical protein MZV70_48900 [Desulfobacterales bacterium]|nr:hypothetical protein [Desulfobacterales bacterium]
MKYDKVLLDHGSGGKISHRMTRDLLLPAFNNPILGRAERRGHFRAAGPAARRSPRTPTPSTPSSFPAGTSASWPSTAR